MGRYSLPIPTKQIVADGDHVDGQVLQRANRGVLHGVVGDAEVDLVDGERRQQPDRLAADGEVLGYRPDPVVISVRRLLDDGVEVALEPIDEAALSGRGCRPDDVLPEPEKRKGR